MDKKISLDPNSLEKSTGGFIKRKEDMMCAFNDSNPEEILANVPLEQLDNRKFRKLTELDIELNNRRKDQKNNQGSSQGSGQIPSVPK